MEVEFLLPMGHELNLFNFYTKEKERMANQNSNGMGGGSTKLSALFSKFKDWLWKLPPHIPLIVSGAIAVAAITVSTIVSVSAVNNPKNHVHSYGEWSVETAATCVTEGTSVRYCECGDKQTSTVGATGHTYDEWTVVEAATCEKDGSKVRYCVCGMAQQAEVSSVGHQFGEWEITSNATCKDIGSERRSCECGKTETREIAKNNSHIEVVDKAIASTCTSAGLTEGSHCSVCRIVIVEQKEIDILPHTYDDRYDDSCNNCDYVRVADCPHTNTITIPGKAATCTNSGVTEGKRCLSCGKDVIAQTEITTLGHTESAWIIDSNATCTANGTRHTECTVCRDTVKSEIIYKLSHLEGEWIIDSNATCTVSGVKHTECTVCKTKIKDGIVDKISHREGEWIIDTNPTCTDAGNKHTECVVCSNTIRIESIPALGHLGNEWIYDTVPTCTESGARHKLCSRCSCTFNGENLSALGHTKGTTVKENEVKASCTEDGYYYSVVYCSSSGCDYEFSRTRTTLESEGHDYSGGYCTICSAVDPYPGAIRIYTYSDLVNMKNNLSGTYVLMNDIDCQGLSFTSVGSDGTNAFIGLFEGQGYTISNYTASNSNYIGLFGYNKGTIRNLNVKDFVYNVTPASSDTINAGGIVGYNGGKIEKCAAINGIIRIVANNTCRAGLVCGYTVGNVLDCFATGDIYINQQSATSNWRLAGGISGVNEGKISNCFVEATVYTYGFKQYTFSSDRRGESGLITSVNEKNGTISNCVVMGSVAEGNNRQGDICGRNDGVVLNCYRDENVVLSGTGEKFERASVQTLSSMSTQIFYSSNLGWSSDIWNFTNVNLSNKIYPTLKQK